MAILVTGASGLLGANVVLHLIDSGVDVVAASFRSPINSVCPSFALDLSEPGAAAELLSEVRPRVVIHTAAATNVDQCEEEPGTAYRMNEGMAEQVAAAANAHGARLIHMSTDAVFDGSTNRDYSEDDESRPVNVYGRSKLAGERAVLRAHPSALIVRTTIYGWNAQPKHSLGEYFVQRLARGEKAPGFRDVWMTPILVNDLADKLLRIIELNVTGILHVAGHDCVSKEGFGKLIAAQFRFDPDLVEPSSVADAGLRAPRAMHPCLRVASAETILGTLPTAAEGVRRFHELYVRGLPARLQGLLRGD